MKTITKNNVFDREPDEIAEFKVRHQGWIYCPKKQWKENVRDFKKEKIEEEVIDERTNKPYKGGAQRKPYQKPKRS